MSAPERFVLTIEGRRDGRGSPRDRLKVLVKVIGNSFGFRVVEYRPVSEPQDPSPSDAVAASDSRTGREGEGVETAEPEAPQQTKERDGRANERA